MVLKRPYRWNMETRSVHPWDGSARANQFLPTLIQVLLRNCLSPITHAQGRGFCRLQRPRCPWAPVLCLPRRSYLRKEAGWLCPCQCLHLVLEVSVPERLGDSCHFPLVYMQVLVLSPREPHHSPRTPPESHRRFLFFSLPPHWVHSTALFWSLGKWWGGDRGLFSIIEKLQGPTGLWGRCWIRGQEPWDSEIYFLLSVSPKGNQSWIFIGRTDAEAETPILWPADAKNWLTGKDPDAWKGWRQEEKGTTEDEMVGWHHRLDGHEFE